MGPRTSQGANLRNVGMTSLKWCRQGRGASNPALLDRAPSGACGAGLTKMMLPLTFPGYGSGKSARVAGHSDLGPIQERGSLRIYTNTTGTGLAISRSRFGLSPDQCREDPEDPRVPFCAGKRMGNEGGNRNARPKSIVANRQAEKSRTAQGSPRIPIFHPGVSRCSRWPALEH